MFHNVPSSATDPVHRTFGVNGAAATETQKCSAYVVRYTDPGYGNATVCPLQGEARTYSALPKECPGFYKSLLGSSFITPEPRDDALYVVLPRPWTVFCRITPSSPNGDFTGLPYMIIPPFEERSWNIVARGVQIARLEASVIFQYDEPEGGVTGMDWRGIWGADLSVKEDEDRMEVYFTKFPNLAEVPLP